MYNLQHLIKFMLTFELTETDKHSIKILLRRKNLRFLRRTNLIKSRCTQAEKMTRTILTILILIGFVGVSFGQINVNGGIYTDSTLTKPISKVKLILKTDSGKKTYRTDKNGKFNILTEKTITEFSIEFKKKGYITVIVNGISTNKTFDVIFRKALSVHEIGYEGASEIIIRN